MRPCSGVAVPLVGLQVPTPGARSCPKTIPTLQQIQRAPAHGKALCSTPKMAILIGLISAATGVENPAAQALPWMALVASLALAALVALAALYPCSPPLPSQRVPMMIGQLTAGVACCHPVTRQLVVQALAPAPRLPLLHSLRTSPSKATMQVVLAAAWQQLQLQAANQVFVALLASPHLTMLLPQWATGLRRARNLPQTLVNCLIRHTGTTGTLEFHRPHDSLTHRGPPVYQAPCPRPTLRGDTPGQPWRMTTNAKAGRAVATILSSLPLSRSLPTVHSASGDTVCTQVLLPAHSSR